MNAVFIGPLVFVLLVISTLVGFLLSRWLPATHLDRDSRDAIRVSTAVVGTLTALALSLLVTSAKTTYENARVELRTSTARIILLDRVMRQYGPEADRARTLLRAFVESRLKTVWAADDPSDEKLDDTGIEPVQEALRALDPHDAPQRLLQARALQVSGQIAEAHWIMSEGMGGSIPTAFVAVLSFWLCLLFVTFGLLGPTNWTVQIILFACALSVSAAMFLIVDMDHPYRGVVHVSNGQLRLTLDRLNEP